MTTPVPEPDRELSLAPTSERIGGVTAMLLLTFSTGVIDAVGYLGLDRVFTGNMTGNVVILGMGLTGADGLPVIGPAIALTAFMIGAAIAGRVLVDAGAGWRRQMTVLYLVQGAILLGLGIVMSVIPVTPETFSGYTVTGVMALAMGAQAGNARSFGVKDITTVVVTSTLTGLAADSRLAGGPGTRAWRRLLAVVCIAAGAGAGALCLRVGLGLGVIICGVLTLAAVVIGEIAERRS